jgi:hypothetical protein
MTKKIIIELLIVIGIQIYLFHRIMYGIYDYYHFEQFVSLMSVTIGFTIYCYLTKVIIPSIEELVKKDIFLKRTTGIGLALLIFLMSVFEKLHIHGETAERILRTHFLFYMFFCILLATSCFMENKHWMVASVIRTSIFVCLCVLMVFLLLLYFMFNIM